MQRPSYTEGLRELIAHYDAFIVDQWGVIHEGKQFYPGAVETFECLKEANKPAIILTNSRKRASRNVERLTHMGLPPDLYTGLVSSAEILRDLLISQSSPPWNSLGDKVYIVAVQEDYALIQGTQYKSVPSIEQADFVLLLSTTEDIPDSAHDHWLNVAAKRNLPVFSSSADPLTVSPRGIFSGLAGIADAFTKLGGTIINIGKPDAIVYDPCLRLLPGINRSRVLAIGDQFASDVIGAKRLGFHAALVMTGAGEITFRNAHTIQEVTAVAQGLSLDQLSVDWILPRLQW